MEYHICPISLFELWWQSFTDRWWFFFCSFSASSFFLQQNLAAGLAAIKVPIASALTWWIRMALTTVEFYDKMGHVPIRRAPMGTAWRCWEKTATRVVTTVATVVAVIPVCGAKCRWMSASWDSARIMPVVSIRLSRLVSTAVAHSFTPVWSFLIHWLILPFKDNSVLIKRPGVARRGWIPPSHGESKVVFSVFCC